jgi:hypothetical protein
MINLTLCSIENIRPFRFLKPERSFLLVIFLCCYGYNFSQNKFQKQLSAKHIKTISINGNQIFSISISTSNTDTIVVTSILDGEYQNQFQVVIKEDELTLKLSLEYMSLEDIPDDKRNAHKVIAATLHLDIPEELKLNILSDIGSVDLQGVYREIYVQLLQGSFSIKGQAEKATINTIDGDIDVMTQSATVEATSNHGKISLDAFSSSNSLWILKSINGDISVAKLD